MRLPRAVPYGIFTGGAPGSLVGNRDRWPRFRTTAGAHVALVLVLRKARPVGEIQTVVFSRARRTDCRGVSGRRGDVECARGRTFDGRTPVTGSRRHRHRWKAADHTSCIASGSTAGAHLRPGRSIVGRRAQRVDGGAHVRARLRAPALAGRRTRFHVMVRHPRANHTVSQVIMHGATTRTHPRRALGIPVSGTE